MWIFTKLKMRCSVSALFLFGVFGLVAESKDPDLKHNFTKSSCISSTATVGVDNSTHFQFLNTEKECFSRNGAGSANNVEDEEDLEIERRLAEVFLEKRPQLDFSGTDISATCKRHVEYQLVQMAELKLWAWKMYDASAQLSSGILNGNVNQLGDFDQCLSVAHPSADGDTLSAQYCLAKMQIFLRTNASSVVKKLHRLVQSHYMIKSNLGDPGHRVPLFSAINWALCVPASCSPGEVEAALRHFLEGSAVQQLFDVDVRVTEDMCQKKSNEPVHFGTTVTGLFFAAVILIIVAATLQDIYVVTDKNEYLQSFSALRNGRKLLCTDVTKDDIGSVHGIRFMNSAMLVVSHKCMALFFLPYHNRTDMAENLGKPWTVIGRAASLYTDPFIMFSGLLTTLAILRKLKSKGNADLVQVYISRLARIVPPFAALIVFCTFLLPYLGSGPQWNAVITHHATICKQYWWRNLLFIHNYYGFENMCLTHTHHIGIDTQLFLVTPPVVLLLWRWPKRTVQTLLTLATLSTLARYAVTYNMGLSNYVFYGTSVQQLFATANHMYILPAHRATVYIMGMLLGYLLYQMPKIALSENQLRIGWAVSTTSFLASFLGPAPMGSLQYEYSAFHAACYAAFAPVAWCAFFGWIIYTSHLGHSSTIATIFEWRGFAIWTKLSYAVYLTQFPVFFYAVGEARTPLHYSFMGEVFNLRDIFWVMLTSVALTLIIDMPCQNLKAVIFKSDRSKKKLVIDKVIKNIPEISDVKVKESYILSNGDICKENNDSVSIVEKYRFKHEWKAD